MKITTQITSLGLLAAMATAAFAPVAALADNQSNKNNGRNLGIGGAAVLGYGLLKHNTAATVLGGIGAVAGAKMYEDNRKAQSRKKAAYEARRRYYLRHRHRSY